MRVEELKVNVYAITTESPEADETFRWDSATMVLVEAVPEYGQRGLGFSYASTAAGTLIDEILASVVAGCLRTIDEKTGLALIDLEASELRVENAGV